MIKKKSACNVRSSAIRSVINKNNLRILTPLLLTTHHHTFISHKAVFDLFLMCLHSNKKYIYIEDEGKRMLYIEDMD